MTLPYGRIGVVVAEAGASTSLHVEAIRQLGAEILLLRQHPNEPPERFVRRCRGRLAEISRSGAHIVEARFAGGESGGNERILTRAALVRILVAPMALQRQGRLVLASPRSDELSMKGLASVVEEQVRGTGVAVTAELEEDASAEREARADDSGREPRA